ncbi:MAG: Rieske 2Fe-2S domain-containing protein [Planctomycetes bacterium]|nr:Rieske 2Fe-2S domain-containing protein [Planctomycetota bacterium]
MALLELIALEKCRINGGTFVSAGGNEYAVFRLTEPDRVVITDNACPHASGNLSSGAVEGGVVTCPWHQWKFDLDRGVCLHSDHARLSRYPCTVKDGIVYAELDVGAANSVNHCSVKRNVAVKPMSSGL